MLQRIKNILIIVPKSYPENVLIAVFEIRLILFDMPEGLLIDSVCKKKSPLSRRLSIVRVSRDFYFLLTVPAAGDDPEINTDNTDLTKRNKLKDGL